MDFVLRHIWIGLILLTGVIGSLCAAWYLINRHRRKRLAPQDEGQLSRAAHSLGEAQWSLWKLRTWGRLAWSAPRLPRSKVADRRRERRRQRQLSEAAASRGVAPGLDAGESGSGTPR